MYTNTLGLSMSAKGDILQKKTVPTNVTGTSRVSETKQCVVCVCVCVCVCNVNKDITGKHCMTMCEQHLIHWLHAC